MTHCQRDSAHSTSTRAGVVASLLLALLWFQPPAAAQQQVADVGSATVGEAAEVTYAGDVAAILQENCQVCHREGAIAPMALTTYEEVRPWAPLIRDRVVEREMPPYHYDTDIGIQELQEDKRLSEAEIQTIVKWVEQGAPAGDLAEVPPEPEWPDPAEWRMAERFGQPDVVIPSTPYDVPADGQDIWWQPTVPTGIEEDRCIKAIETKPTVEGQAFTHHANSSFMVENAEGEMERFGRLSEYALGKLGEIIPADACRIAPADSYVSWDIHYFPNGTALEDDQVEVGIWYHDEPAENFEYEQDLTLYFLEGGDYDIPPHGTLVAQGFHSFDHPVRIDSFQPHMHLRGTAASLEIFHPETGERELISMISNWNPEWQLSHVYEEDVAPLVPAGSVLEITQYYDNTENNPYNPDPNQWVGAGQRTADEMSHAWIAVTHLDQEGYEALVAERAAMEEEDATAAGDD